MQRLNNNYIQHHEEITMSVELKVEKGGLNWDNNASSLENFTMQVRWVVKLRTRGEKKKSETHLR